MRTRKQPDFRFTIIAGSLKGKVITVPNLGVTRPPLTRLRRAIFDFLNPYLHGAQYLDLFSGTGSYLFEAVSRGAARATGVELEKRLADSINQQARNLGIADQLTCLNDDVFKAIPRLASHEERFDIIMLAPPQYVGLIDKALVLLKEHPLLWSDGMIICQHDTSETPKIEFGDFGIAQRRKYGNTTFTILR
ncbi:MAG: 16S rRNA (guanine(966)-N(2))-methyltransferase RsmD [Candidatus Zixiibacteriota bacterium]